METRNVLDRLWQTFDHISEMAEVESEQEHPNLEDMETLVRVSSQAASNYTYHKLYGHGSAVNASVPRDK